MWETILLIILIIIIVPVLFLSAFFYNINRILQGKQPVNIEKAVKTNFSNFLKSIKNIFSSKKSSLKNSKEDSNVEDAEFREVE